MAEADASSRAGNTSAPSVWIVVLNRRGRSYTIACLRAVAAVAYPNISLVLIDNGCQDFAADEVAQLVPGAHYLQVAVNRGFTGGVNLGIRHALQHGGDYVLLLNNDAIIEPEAVTELVRVASSDPSIGIVGAKMLQLDTPGTLESAGLLVDLRFGRTYQMGFGEPDRGQYDAATDRTAVSGGAMFLSRAVCDRLGGFDERYFRYVEDIDVCLRAQRAGFRVVFAPRARVHHKGKGMAAGKTSPLILYYSVRNHLMLMREYGKGGLIALLRVPIICLLYAAYALRAQAGLGWTGLAAVWRGWWDYQRGVVGAAPSGDP
jgi:GT2 family glycosyltransferase